MKAVDYFYFVRDIPYKIPTSLKEADHCCSGKHEILFNLLKSSGLEVRYRVCVFLWSSFKLPSILEKISYEKDSTHTYLEVKIKDKWETLDATWDIGLKKVFPINSWGGKSGTRIAVKPVEIFSPAKSTQIVKNQTKRVIEKDLKLNGKFYKAFNKWLDIIRKK
jgi:hypothetical protein